MSETLKDQLTRQEGLRLKPYLDCCGKPWRECTCLKKGKLTIGIGRNLDDVGMTKPEVLFMLDNDIQRATTELRAAFPWVDELNWARKAVLINMTFNMGINKLSQFHQTLAAVAARDYKAAAGHMLESLWARQVGKRANELAKIMESGEM